MTEKVRRVAAIFFFAIGTLGLSLSPAQAGVCPAASTAVGRVSASSDVTINGAKAQESNIIFSGDVVRANKGVATVFLKDGKGSQVTLLFGAAATINRESNQVAVRLEPGNGSVTFTHSATDSLPLRITSENVSVSAPSHVATSGAVEVGSQKLTVSATKGSVQLEGNGKKIAVPAGRELRLSANELASGRETGKSGPSKPGRSMSVHGPAPRWILAENESHGGGGGDGDRDEDRGRHHGDHDLKPCGEVTAKLMHECRPACRHEASPVHEPGPWEGDCWRPAGHHEETKYDADVVCSGGECTLTLQPEGPGDTDD